MEVRALLHAHNWFGYSGSRRTTPNRLRRYCRQRLHRQKLAHRESWQPELFQNETSSNSGALGPWVCFQFVWKLQLSNVVHALPLTSTRMACARNAQQHNHRRKALPSRYIEHAGPPHPPRHKTPPTDRQGCISEIARPGTTAEVLRAPGSASPTDHGKFKCQPLADKAKGLPGQHFACAL